MGQGIKKKGRKTKENDHTKVAFNNHQQAFVCTLKK